MARKQVHPVFWLGLALAVLVWLLPQPQDNVPGKVKAPEKAAVPFGFSPQKAKALIVQRDLFRPLVEANQTPQEPQADISQPPPLLPEFPVHKPPLQNPSQSPAASSKHSPLSGLVLRGVVESEQGKFALLEGPSFPAAYVAEGQSQGQVKVRKIGPDWAEVEAQGERKTLRLPGEFSVEPLSKKTGGGQR